MRKEIGTAIWLVACLVALVLALILSAPGH